MLSSPPIGAKYEDSIPFSPHEHPELMSDLEISQWDIHLSEQLRKINSMHANKYKFEWMNEWIAYRKTTNEHINMPGSNPIISISQTDDDIRKSVFEDINDETGTSIENGGFNVISIYKYPNGHTRMLCNICNALSNIANYHQINKNESKLVRCPMADNFGPFDRSHFIKFDDDISNAKKYVQIGQEYDALHLKDHFENNAHKKCLRYLAMINFINALLLHEFGGSDVIVIKFNELLFKMMNETLPKPPLYPFEKASIQSVTKRLSDSLMFSQDQSEFIEDIIWQCMVVSEFEHCIKPKNTFTLIQNVQNMPSTLSELDSVKNALNVIGVATPIFMKRIFQTMMRQNNMLQTNENNEFEMDRVQNLFNSAFRTIKSTIMDDIKQANDFNAFDNVIINEHNWKYKDLSLSLLFDIFSVYRINQYVNHGKFEINLHHFQQQIGGLLIENDINMQEAAAFIDGIEYYKTHIVEPIDLRKQYVVNGNVVQFMTYVFALSSFVKKLLNENTKNNDGDVYGMQFDLVFIAGSVTNVFTNESVQNEVIKTLDLESNLKKHKLAYSKQLIRSDDLFIDRYYIQSLIQQAMNDPALLMNAPLTATKCNDQRFVILIDKRGEDDILYVYRYNNNVVGKDGLWNDGIMHYLTQRYLIPMDDDSASEWIGSQHSMSGHLMTYSFHIHANDERRCYFYYNGGVTRTFPEHFVDFIPRLFEYNNFSNDAEYKKKFQMKLFSHEYKHGFDLVLTDNVFGQWYRRITGCFHISVNYYRTKIAKEKGENDHDEIIMANKNEKLIKELSKEEFCHIFAALLKKNSVDFEMMQLKKCIINELRLDGQNFTDSDFSANDFCSGLSTIMNKHILHEMFKKLQYLSSHEIGVMLEDYEPAKLAENTVEQNEKEAKMKELADLNVEEMVIVLMDCIQGVVKKDHDLNTDEVKKQIAFDGKMFVDFDRKSFAKMMKEVGLNGGPSAKLFKAINGLAREDINKILALNGMLSDDKDDGVKSIEDLNLDQMFEIICYCMNELNLEVDEAKVEYLLKTDKKMDGSVFKATQRKEFANVLKTIGITGGGATKLFKKLNSLSAEDMMNVLRENSEKKVEDTMEQLDQNQEIQNTEDSKEECVENHEVQSIEDLNIEQMFSVFLHCMDAAHVECDYDKIETLLKIDHKMDGASFKQMKKKDFTKMLKAVGLKGGLCTKMFTALNKMSIEDIKKVLIKEDKDNEVQVLEIKPQPNIFLKALNELTCDELNVILVAVITNNNIIIDGIDKITEVTIKQDINGAKIANQRKEFCTIYKSAGITSGKLAKIFRELNQLQPDQIAVYLKAAQSKDDDYQNESNDAKDEEEEKKMMIDDTHLETVNIDDFGHLFVQILKEKNIESDYEKLQQILDVMKKEKIDGKKFSSLKAAEIAKLFKPIKLKAEFAVICEARNFLINLDPNAIARKLLVPAECNGELEQCPNVRQLCVVLELFHNKSVKELMDIKFGIADTIKLMNNYSHLTSKHNLFGDQMTEIAVNNGETTDELKQMSSQQQYEQFQSKVCEVVKSRIGPCKCHGKDCYFVQRHARDIEVCESVEQGKEDNAVVLDTIASMHTFIFHNVEDQLYRLYDRNGKNRDNVHKDKEDDEKTNNQDSKPDTPPPSLQKMKAVQQGGKSINIGVMSADQDDDGDDGGMDSYHKKHKNDQNVHKNISRFATAALPAEKLKESAPVLNKFAAPVLNKLASTVNIFDDDDEKKMNVEKKKVEEIMAIDFGEKLDDWFSPLDSPIFNSVYEEVTQNEYEKIFDETYKEIKQKCQIIMQSDKNIMFFNLDQLIAIKLYTDCDKLQNRFRRAFWSGKQEADDIKKRVRLSFFEWALMLQKTIIYGATPIIFNVYHGLSNLFTVQMMLPIFNGPISTTTSSTVATKFADTKGMLWKITPRIWSQLENPVGIKVDWISRFEYEKEVLLMNCPLPIRKTTAFEAGIKKRLDYLLDYLAKYNEPITDKKKFFAQIGFDEMMAQVRNGSELERLWMCDLGKTESLWKVCPKYKVPLSKPTQWLNCNEAFDENYWAQYVKEKIEKFGRGAERKFYQRQMKKDAKQIAEEQRVFAYGFVIRKEFEPMKRAITRRKDEVKQKLLKLSTVYHSTAHDQNLMEQHKKELRALSNAERNNEYKLTRKGAIHVLSLLRNLPTTEVENDEKCIKFLCSLTEKQIVAYLKGKNYGKMLRLEYSVYYRLVNELGMIYLPFAAFASVEYNGPFISRQERRDLYNDEQQQRNLFTQRKAKQSNLFCEGRYAKIVHAKEGAALLQEFCIKHRVEYRLQFRFRPDKQRNYTHINYDLLKIAFIETYHIDGALFMQQIYGNEFELVSYALALAKCAECIPSHTYKAFCRLSDDDVIDMNASELYDDFEDFLKNDIAQVMREVKSERYNWQFTDIQVSELMNKSNKKWIPEVMHLNIATCNNFEILNVCNIWNYKLMVCVLDEDPDKYVCVHKGKFEVDLDCIVDGDYKINSFEAMHHRDVHYSKKFDENVWLFRSLHLKKDSKLTIEPFGYNFINPRTDEGKGNKNDYFNFGSIRIFCYESLIIEEGAQINVNGKGVFGHLMTESLNKGRGGHIEWRNPMKKPKYNDAGTAIPSLPSHIYSGGGYGTNGMPVIDESNAKKNKNNGNGQMILNGGSTFGDERLDVLHYGSSGGKGGLSAGKMNYFERSDRGGGIIELIAQNIVNEGSILANGRFGYQGNVWNSCGSGGSIKIKCKKFKNEGFISAKGGKLPLKANKNSLNKDGQSVIDEYYEPLHGNGGDGRIAIYYDQGLDETDKSLNCMVDPRPYHAKTSTCKRSKLPDWNGPF